MMSVIVIQSICAIFYLLMKKAVFSFYKYEKEHWDKMKGSYYWAEYLFIFTATVITPKHTLNEGWLTLLFVIMIKLGLDSMKFIDDMFDAFFHRHHRR